MDNIKFTVLRYSSLNSTVTLKSRLVVAQGHCKSHDRINFVRIQYNSYSSFIVTLELFYTIYEI